MARNRRVMVGRMERMVGSGILWREDGKERRMVGKDCVGRGEGLREEERIVGGKRWGRARRLLPEYRCDSISRRDPFIFSYIR